MPSFEETIDNLTDTQRAYIASALDAFDAAHPEVEYGVEITDLDDDTLAALIAEADALPQPVLATPVTAGAAAGGRLFLHRTGNPALPHTCRSLLRLRPPAPAECEVPACAGCAWCDTYGITVPPLQAIAALIKRHNTDESFTADAEQVIEAIERILANAGVK
jgi:hypothetical protein